MILVQIFDPEPYSDEQVEASAELTRIAQMVEDLTASGLVEVERVNLQDDPEAFDATPAVAQILTDKGLDGLPVTIVSDVLLGAGAYPSTDLVEALVDVPLTDEAKGAC